METVLLRCSSALLGSPKRKMQSTWRVIFFGEKVATFCEKFRDFFSGPGEFPVTLWTMVGWLVVGDLQR